MRANEINELRLDFIDNLRSFSVALVVLLHAVITYSHVGSWYFADPKTPGAVEVLVFSIFEAHCQAFFMGLLFFLAGYFTPGAYDRKAAGRFLKDRFLRLGLPSLVYIFLIQPLILHGLMHYGHGGYVEYYRDYLALGRFLSGSGPMWFAIALLFFSAIYVGWRRMGGTLPVFVRIKSPGWGMVFAAGLITGMATFAVRLVQPVGTSVLNMQLCFFPQYLVMFALGIIAFRNDWLMSLCCRRVIPWTLSLVFLSVVVLGILGWVGGLAKAGLEPFAGGWKWPSLGYAVWEQVFGFLFSGLLLVLFRDYFNVTNRVLQVARDSSFGVYFLHSVVVIAIGQGLVSVEWPVFVKAPLLGGLSILVTTLLVYFVGRRIPVVKKLL
jgi:hypothetical protein